MTSRNLFAVLFAMLLIALLTVSASADQDGYDTWCNSDQYGCWVTDEDGGKCYIMFWSEESRAYFMGGNSKPGELVTDMPEEASYGRVGMGSAPSRSWRVVLKDLYNKYRELLESQGLDIEESLQHDLETFEKQIENGGMKESEIIDLLESWADAYENF